ncbi:MAG TPA: alanine--tRNA ligase [Chitinivibrionales bacterium]|nr:alanine--tRNA ligase [Chitinivibrionales bacterium]
MTKSGNQIRQEFIDFFKSKGHLFVPSAPVIPQDDPTLLFTNAGMNQFKAIFLGENRQGYTRVANSQKCMRVSGKHNDLEEVGRDHYHHTFFEMLGNWSFGNYYKKEAISWAWELLTEVWKLHKDRLFVTVFESDDEAEKLWKSETDIEHWRIMRFGEKSNFWEMGDTGPCGPCSEIHYDIGDAKDRKQVFNDPVRGVNGANDRFREIWNLVFIQYNRGKDGKLSELPSKHVDTGMGLERVVSILQNTTSNYGTDLFLPIIAELAKKSGKPYSADASGTPFRVIADHIRALVFAITDGGVPSNEGRGYVLRRLLRRASRFGRELRFHEPFLFSLVPVVVNMMGDAFPEIKQRTGYVSDVIRSEEERFGATLEQGIEKFGQILAGLDKSKAKTVPGGDVFMLYDTYGFPMDLTRLMAEEKGYAVDEKGFEKEMGKQRERARDAAKKGDESGLTAEGWVTLRQVQGTQFVGYESDTAQCNVCRYKITVSDGPRIRECLLILDKTPFYAESGGQVGDAGVLTTARGTVLRVSDTIKWNDMTVHIAASGESFGADELKEPVRAEILSTDRRHTRRNHSATHLLQAALRKVLGTHVQQSGSRVAPESLRFDFTHHKALTPDELRKVEDMVNEWVLADFPVATAVKSTDEAKKEGAMALFGEKYGETVRVVSMGGVSKELCGGTHVSSTGTIGLFHITAEMSIAAGVRRIEAITGMNSVKYLSLKESTVSELCRMLKVNEDALVNRVEGLGGRIKELEQKMAGLSQGQVKGRADAIIAEAQAKKAICSWTMKDLGATDKETFSSLCDAISDAIKSRNLGGLAVILGASIEGRVLFFATAGQKAVKDCGVHCGELVKAAAQIAGGSGGGSPTRAQAGGKNPEKLGEALAAVREILEKKAGQHV